MNRWINFWVYVLCMILFSAGSTYTYGQAVISKKMEWQGRIFYPDAVQKHLFYYLPGKLTLKTDDQGKPEFLLTQMRYRGASCTDDQGESRFFNLLNFTVKMESESLPKMSLVKEHFGDDVQLITLPIRHISTTLITTVEGANSGNEIIKLANHGTVESQLGHTNVFWTERAYSMKLQNHEAEIISHQIEENNLALSLAYSYFADGIWGNNSKINLIADKESSEELHEIMDSTMLSGVADTIVQPYFVFADAFPIEIDAEIWPGIVRKVDINEDMPPTYPAIEVRCYDFNEKLNPNLYYKKIEIQSTGVNGRPILVSTKFYNKNSDITKKNIYFPFAVRMDKPINYRIIGYALNGEPIISDWIITDACTAMVDITQLKKDQNYVREEIEIEVNAEIFDSLDTNELTIELKYLFQDEETSQHISFKDREELLYRSLYLWRDKNSDFQINYKYKDKENNSEEGKLDLPSDRYLYVNSKTL